MAKRSRRHRVATALRLEAEARGQRATRPQTKPYVEPEPHKPTTPIAKQRQRRLKGCIKWQGGQPTLKYARSGYGYVGGDYVKIDPRATGITQSFGTNRAEEREQRAKQARKRGTRAKSKAAARERYERVKPINAERQRALKADKQTERAKRLLHHAYLASVDKIMGVVAPKKG